MYQQLLKTIIHNNVQVNNLMNLIDLFEKYKLAFNETYKLAITVITTYCSIQCSV